MVIAQESTPGKAGDIRKKYADQSLNSKTKLKAISLTLKLNNTETLQKWNLNDNLVYLRNFVYTSFRYFKWSIIDRVFSSKRDTNEQHNSMSCFYMQSYSLPKKFFLDITAVHTPFRVHANIGNQALQIVASKRKKDLTLANYMQNNSRNILCLATGKLWIENNENIRKDHATSVRHTSSLRNFEVVRFAIVTKHSPRTKYTVTTL